ncbi:SDR family NAD(P)-dependent oxidoreductase [Actinoplanes sp. CA-131856]
MGALDGKTIVVTGAARGQGAATASALTEAGASVVAVDVLPAADCIAFDVRDVTGWRDLASSLPVVHGLINNAGVAGRDRLPNVPLDAWERTFAINVTGPLLGIQALVPRMPAGASIVNVCSVAALSGHVAAAYTSSKWALRGLTRTASLELGARGIRVNAVLPGLIETPLMESASPAFRAAAIAEIPLARTGTVGDIAPLMVFLMSDASSYMTGAELVVDGGMTAHVSHKRIADAIGSP